MPPGTRDFDGLSLHLAAFAELRDGLLTFPCCPIICPVMPLVLVCHFTIQTGDLQLPEGQHPRCAIPPLGRSSESLAVSLLCAAANLCSHSRLYYPGLRIQGPL